jgi:formate dehydrogenase subunit delta
MDPNKLVKMANDIATFFDADTDRAARLAGISGHIKRFWDPRMRLALFRYLDQDAGAGLKDSVIEALTVDRDSLLPKP